MSDFLGQWPCGASQPTILACPDGKVISCPKTDVTIRLDGKLFGNDSARKGLASHELLDAYNRKGIACLEQMQGEFSALIWDPNIRRLFVIKDHIGVKPLFVTKTSEGLFIASNKSSLLALEGVDNRADDFWMVEYLTQSNFDHPNTYHKGIKRILPAHYLEFDGKSAQMKRYWSLSNAPEIRYSNSQEYVDHFLDALKTSISERIQTPSRVATELSGGLDSTAITALASEMLKQRGLDVHPFSHIRPSDCDPEYQPKDEYREIIEFCEFSQIPRPSFLESNHISGLHAVDRAIRLQSGPTAQTFTMFSDELNDKAAEAGCSVLLSGFGGDECATGHAPSMRSELVHRGKWLKLLRMMNQFRPEKIHRNIRMLSHEFIRKKMPLANTFWGYNNPKTLFHQVAQIKKTYLEPSQIRKYAKMFASEGSKPWGAFESEREQQVYQFENNAHVSLRLESSSLHAASKNIHISFPLLDKRLLELVVGMPLEQKVGNGHRRYLMRCAMKGYLPESLRWRVDKGGAAVPGAQWRQLKNMNAVDIDPLRKIAAFNFKKFSEDLPKFFELEPDPTFRKQGVFYALIVARFLKSAPV